MATSGRGVGWAFLAIGCVLLAGALFAYDRIVVRPASWPATDALIVSSGVVNPRGPSDYSPRLVFRLGGDAARDVTVTPSWSSSSYAIVRGHVDRFPAGSRVMVAVNPADPDDVRYDLTASLNNLLVPGVLGLLGLVFTGVGVFSLRSSQRERELAWSAPPRGTTGPTFGGPGADPGRGVRIVPPIFIVIGIIITAIGALMVRADLVMLKDWPQVDARVLESRVVTTSSSSSRRSSGPMYDAEVKFRYVLNGVTYENSTTYGVRSSSRSRADARAEAYGAGTVHRIWHRPGDPNAIRFDLDSTLAVFVLPGGMVLMGLVFITLGGLVWRLMGSARSSPPEPELE